MDTDPRRHEDSRDSRTGSGESASPLEERDIISERWTRQPPDDEVNADFIGAGPSNYTEEDIEEGDNPDDDELKQMVDPSIGHERMSTNPDVMDLDSAWREESEEPDFMRSPGTTDLAESVEEGEPYFPPTDPPIARKRLVNAEVRGGFAITSLEAPTEAEDEPPRLMGDEEIAEEVRNALLADSYTADLNIEVEVEDGVVFLHGKVGSMEDVEQAEEVAGNVAGVDEVQEDLEIV